MTCYYDAVTLSLPAKETSHFIALTIKRALKLHYFQICYSMQTLLKLAAKELFY